MSERTRLTIYPMSRRNREAWREWRYSGSRARLHGSAIGFARIDSRRNRTPAKMLLLKRRGKIKRKLQTHLEGACIPSPFLLSRPSSASSLFLSVSLPSGVVLPCFSPMFSERAEAAGNNGIKRNSIFVREIGKGRESWLQ